MQYTAFATQGRVMSSQRQFYKEQRAKEWVVEYFNDARSFGAAGYAKKWLRADVLSELLTLQAAMKVAKKREESWLTGNWPWRDKVFYRVRNVRTNDILPAVIM
jgi:hypothetical protein